MAGWLGALVVVAGGGWWLNEAGRVELLLGDAQPFIGGLLRPDPGRLLLPVAAAGLAVWLLPHLSRRLSWAWLLVASTGFAAGWAAVLTTARAWDDFPRPLNRDDDYFTALPIADIPGFIAGFTDQILTYATHIQGHPPGQVVLLALLDKAGLAEPWLVALGYVVVGTSAVAAAAVAMRSLAGDAGEDLARRMFPAAVLAPAAVWIATSADAFFSGVLAWGTALLAVACARWTAGRPWLLPGIGAGLLLGLCPFLSYGLLPMGLITLAVVWHTRALPVLGLVAALVGLQAAVWAAFGFLITDGIAATAEAWALDAASVRPYWYFLFANFVVLATVVGPATLASLPSWRRLVQPAPLFVGLAVAAAIAGTLLGFMRGEVERIWLPLTPWLMLAASVVGPRRGWLGAQAAVAIAAAAFIESPW